MRPWGYESTEMCHVRLDMNIFLVLYTLDRKFLLIDGTIWQVHTGKIGNNELCRYTMWINYLKN